MRTVFVDFEASEAGFLDLLPRERAPSLKLEDEIKNVMSHCHGMVQILPREYLANTRLANPLKWMFYERAFAAAKGMPVAVCIDVSDCGLPTFDTWVQAMSINAGEYLYKFDSSKSSDEIVKVFAKALSFVYGSLLQSHHPPKS